MLERLKEMFSGRDSQRDHARDLYSDIVLQAREPFFYEKLAVADTVEGRFDMITLHMFLVLRRLREDPDHDQDFAQVLFDVMFRNMDDSLREMGVGDLVVGKRVRKLAEDFYGRVGVYDEVFESREKLTAALGRNVFGREDHPHAPSLCRYVTKLDESLKNQKIERLKLGICEFPAPEAASV